ncbi:ABC transporter substrate-binding protein [Dyadobacter psychrotolerans]|uniref:ABC transporter substrate-binding protein n=1 Tax=Dyadobacter psychrotolerans TaxID=2541721 RepID=A0A4R5DMW9_9BACT|nr:ABC transporter substrate-binding protein [Dyadobacter psychrotolerans]TDE12043.1 ABC transporter substrate-binding protein [Dyadobacter psychrotolerans]
MKEFTIRPFLSVLIIYLLLAGCTSNTSEKTEQKSTGSKKDYYSEKLEIKHAKGFRIKYFNNYKIVEILNPFEKNTDTTRYLLLQRRTVRPTGFTGHQVIEIPIRSLATTSSMHVGLLDFLESIEVLKGIGGTQYIYSPKVIQLIKEGKIPEVGKDQGLNEEKLVSMHPDLIMAMGSPGAGMSKYQTLADAGIPVLINSEWVETTPLARAEWVKLLAALLNKEELANRKFSVIENEYQRLATLVKQAKTKPSVISGLNTKDTWFLPSGDSYMARFFKDAGADYHWAETKATGSLALGFETVYPIALKADYWLNVGFNSSDSKKDILAQDSRYDDFNAYKSGHMYSYNNRVNDKGANDFFESGNVNPQRVLADLIKIFHPELLPEHQLFYYKNLK